MEEATQFQTNTSRPVHGWFHFKEGFSAELLTAAGVDLDPMRDENAVFLDPFCGSGTTLLAFDIQHQLPATRVGVELNPFLAFAANTKVRWRQYDPTRVEQLVDVILREPLETDIVEDEWPALSTFHNRDIFDPEKLSALLSAVSRISERTESESDLLLLGAAAAAEQIGYYRKDGRALRILRGGERRQRQSLDVATVLREVWLSYSTDLAKLASSRSMQTGEALVVCANGRKPPLVAQSLLNRKVPLIAYSPPYLNHIDYTEVYKVELWLLGFLQSSEEMLELRRSTLRSHASVKFIPDGIELPSCVTDIVDTVASEIEATGKQWHQYFRNTALAYFEDMQQSFTRQYEILSPGGQVICVVANSAHGSGDHRVPIAVDLLLSELARNVGFEVEKLLVARQLRRRDSLNRFLRETVLVLNKPASV